jgi:hypothetical protein
MKRRNRNGPNVGTNHSPRRSGEAEAGGVRDERTPPIRYSRRAYVNDLQEADEKATGVDAVFEGRCFTFARRFSDEARRDALLPPCPAEQARCPTAP